MAPRKSTLVVLTGILVIVLAKIIFIAFFAKPLILNFAEAKVREAFKGCVVNIGERDLTWHKLVLRKIDVVKFHKPYFFVEEFRLDFTLTALIIDPTVSFSLKGIKVLSKIKADGLRGKASFHNDRLSLKDVIVQFLGGTIRGDVRIKYKNDVIYSANLVVKDIELENAVEAFDVGEKIGLTGVASGVIRISGKGMILTDLGGELTASSAGGTLTIRSQEWLEAIASYAKQDVSVIVDNFKDYRYNKGTLELGLKDGSVLLNTLLEGDAGKRELAVTVHDFNTRR